MRNVCIALCVGHRNQTSLIGEVWIALARGNIHRPPRHELALFPDHLVNSGVERIPIARASARPAELGASLEERLPSAIRRRDTDRRLTLYRC